MEGNPGCGRVYRSQRKHNDLSETGQEIRNSAELSKCRKQSRAKISRTKKKLKRGQ